jgi:hypothetical protein
MKYFVLAAFATAVVTGFGTYRAADKDLPDIETIMQAAHSAEKEDDPTLLKLVVTGKADKEMQKKLLKLYEDLAKNKRPEGKGTDEEWKKRTSAMVAAAKDVLAGKPGAAAALQKVVDCKSCHKLFKD